MALPLILPGSRRCLLGLLEGSAHGTAFSMTPQNSSAGREEMIQRAAGATLGGYSLESWAARLRKSSFLMFFECSQLMYSDFDWDLNSDSFDSTVGPFRLSSFPVVLIVRASFRMKCNWSLISSCCSETVEYVCSTPSIPADTLTRFFLSLLISFSCCLMTRL